MRLTDDYVYFTSKVDNLYHLQISFETMSRDYGFAFSQEKSNSNHSMGKYEEHCHWIKKKINMNDLFFEPLFTYDPKSS